MPATLLRKAQCGCPDSGSADGYTVYVCCLARFRRPTRRQRRREYRNDEKKIRPRYLVPIHAYFSTNRPIGISWKAFGAIAVLAGQLFCSCRLEKVEEIISCSRAGTAGCSQEEASAVREFSRWLVSLLFYLCAEVMATAWHVGYDQIWMFPSRAVVLHLASVSEKRTGEERRVGSEDRLA